MYHPKPRALQRGRKNILQPGLALRDLLWVQTGTTARSIARIGFPLKGSFKGSIVGFYNIGALVPE